MNNLTKEELKLLKFLCTEKLKAKSTITWNKRNKNDEIIDDLEKLDFKNANFKIKK